MAAATLEVTANPAPGPGGRIGRTAGQGGTVVILIQLWQAFDWFGADTWTAEQAGVRWPALTAAGILLASAIQNAWNWWRSERSRPLESVEVTAVNGDAGDG